jgi:LPS sulfotransferase NodH
MLKNFIIVGTQRTGSTALYDALNLHPDIACGGEWTQYSWPQKKLQVLERALSADFSDLTPLYRKLIDEEFDERTVWLGFKILFRSSDKWLLHPKFSIGLWLDRLENCLKWLSRRPDIRVIHIVRSDPLEWLKSKYLATTTRLFVSTPYPEGTKIRIPPHEAVRRLRSKNWIDERLATLGDTNPYMRVFYEDFSRDGDSLLVSLMRFLDCDPGKLGNTNSARVKKQSKGSAQDYISNYDQLMTELRRHALDQGGFLPLSRQAET